MLLHCTQQLFSGEIIIVTGTWDITVFSSTIHKRAPRNETQRSCNIYPNWSFSIGKPDKGIDAEISSSGFYFGTHLTIHQKIYIFWKFSLKKENKEDILNVLSLFLSPSDKDHWSVN